MTEAARTATVPCTFCSTLNRIDLDRLANRPKCGNCSRPILLNRPIRLTDADFDRVVRDARVPLLVDFYADWCMPCKMMAPALDEVTHENQGRLLVGKLDTESNQNSAMRFGIRGIPTLILFENGVEKTRRSGALRREEIEALAGVQTGRH